MCLAFVLAGCIPLTGGAAPTATPAGELGSVLKSGVLVIATDADYPPQSQLLAGAPRAAGTRCNLTQYTAGQLAGFDVDVAAEVARRLGVEPCFVTPTWSQIVGGNWGDRWDVSVGSMAITAERMQKLYFTQPYTSGQAVLFIHKDNQAYKEVEDLSGKRIGVCTGCAYEAYLRGTLEIPGAQIDFRIRGASVVGYDTDTSALADLALGDGARLDAVMTDPDTGKNAIASGLPLKQLAQVVYYDYPAIALDKNSVHDALPLAQRLAEIIQGMHRDGTLARLSIRYYGSDATAPAARYDFQALKQGR